MCRLVGFAFSAAAMAVLLLSVPHEVKITSREGAPISSATCSRDAGDRHQSPKARHLVRYDQYPVLVIGLKSYTRVIRLYEPFISTYMPYAPSSRP